MRDEDNATREQIEAALVQLDSVREVCVEMRCGDGNITGIYATSTDRKGGKMVARDIEAVLRSVFHIDIDYRKIVVAMME